MTDSQMAKLGKTLLAQARYFSNQTYFEGINNLSEFVTGKVTGEEDPDRTLPGSIAYTGTQAIPFSGLLSYVARAMDPVFRKTESDSQLGSAVQTVKRRLPGVSKDLPAYKDPRGNESERNETRFGVGGPFGLAPFETGEANDEYNEAFEARKRKLQENKAMAKTIKKTEKVSREINDLAELGEIDKVRELVMENKEELVKFEAYKELRSEIKELQKGRAEVSMMRQLSDDQKVDIISTMDEHIETRLKILDALGETNIFDNKVPKESFKVDLSGIGETLSKANPINPPEAFAKTTTDTATLKVSGPTIGDYINKGVEAIKGKLSDINEAINPFAQSDESIEAGSKTQAVLAAQKPEIPVAEPTPAPPRVDQPAYYENSQSDQIIVKSGDEGQEPTTVKLPSDISSRVAEVFGDELALQAARILHHPHGETYGSKYYGQNKNKGENPGWRLGAPPEGEEWWDHNYDPEGNVKHITNPFSKEKEINTDRGLFRINNETFYDYLGDRREGYRDAMYEAGIIDEPDYKHITPEKAKEYYDRMYDMEKNVAMAKIIYDKAGWKAWFAAPIELIE